MKTQFIKEKLSAGHPVIGMWSIINSPITSDIAAHAGLDFQIFDLEHGVFELTSLDNCIRSAESMGCSPLVRVASLDRSIIQNCLDLGAHGIIVPQIKNVNQVIEVIQATKFAPDGSRGFNPFTRAGGYNPSLPLAKTKLTNDFGLTGIIAENKAIFTELDTVLTIPGLDIVYLGIYDLSFDLGLNGNVDHPTVIDYVTSALKKIKQAGKYAGLMVKNENEIEQYLALGASLIVYGVDTYTYYLAIENKVKSFKAIATKKFGAVKND